MLWALWLGWLGIAAADLSAKDSPAPREDRQWWSFQPIRRPEPPKMSEAWVRNDVDRFILSTLRSKQLNPSPEASPEVLLRRLFFDLLGVPPSPEELKRFLHPGEVPDYEQWVETLLADRRYGERWARHWLDLVRYADSDGYRVDDFRPNAWRYRDYVIQAFNTDKPYDRFITEQLAGDELWPEDPDALTATGYLRHWIYEYNNRDAVGQWQTILNDITDTTSDVFLGLGMQCARCHDHKFDPLLQKDYFQLQAFFAALEPRDDVTAAPQSIRAETIARRAIWEERTEGLRAQIRKIEDPYRKKASDEARSKFPAETQEILRKPPMERTPYERQIAALAYRQIHHEYERLTPRLSPADKEAVAALRKELASFDTLLPAPLPTPMTVTDVGPVAPPVLIPRKGDQPVVPAFPVLFGEPIPKIQPPASSPQSTGRRAALAQWLTRPDHPLTARVLVNRVWQYHFGRGLVATSSDFGHLGERPSHPELLDWLASEFVRSGWSLKKLHRLILTSATFRQSSMQQASPGKEAEAAQSGDVVDPENRLLWRANVQRLEAEQIRDALIAASGELNPENPGPAADASKFYRSIYTKVLRNTRDPLLDMFDAPQNFSSTSQRDATTTAVQSLHLLHSPFLLQRASAMARRLERQAPGDLSHQLKLAYQLAYGREATSAELREAEQFLELQSRKVDPDLAQSAEAGFLTEKMPFRDGKAAVIAPRTSQEFLAAPMHGEMPRHGFTLEAYFYLRSIADDAFPRTLAAARTSGHTTPAWSIGVTGRKSARRPQIVVFEYAASPSNGSDPLKAVFSDLPVRLDRPYFLAVSASLEDSHPQVRFCLKDLSNDDEPMLVAEVAAPMAVEPSNPHAEEDTLFLGGVPGRSGTWDGLIDEVRLSRGILPQDQLLMSSGGTAESTLGLWRFEAKPGYFRDESSWRRDLVMPSPGAGRQLSTSELALTDLCHVLMNSSEFLYIP